ncbi:MAG TPA: cysteine synthase family protein, partial [Acidimicrobiia bacterium]|nr:cysteine synthase family protein [Acidimicrobiia bacterium]
MARYDSVIDLIGNTPMVSLAPLSPTPDVQIWAKLEGHNPGGSVKDRIARKMIETAEEEGRLAPGDTVLEPSSGNTGIGLAMMCRVRGYRLHIVLPENVSIERRQLLEVFGVDITSSPGDEGSNGAIRVAEEMSKEMDALLLHQYENPANPAAHYETTGPEIW